MSDLLLPMMPPDRGRRRLLTALMLSPLIYSSVSKGATYPDLNRIVALEWLSVELVMALGIIPMAIADKPNYHIWVNDPPLPDHVVDVGFRTEPNLEQLAQLKPSLIIYAEGYGPSAQKMTRISPIMGFGFSDNNGKPLTVAKTSLVKLANALGIPQAAEKHLTQLSQFMQQSVIDLTPYKARPLLLVTLLDTRHALVIGKNSLFQEVMDELGIENAWKGETSFWGSTIIGIERLTEINNAHVLCFEYDNRTYIDQVASSPLWQAMPFVRDRSWQVVPAVWLYGGTLSAMRFVRVLAQALEARA
ncbi:Fe(3+)-hydroxamate ABC transporter substrate-binding protein FhuD [Pectobacterium sp. B1J-3]|uniref:Fe(3+)-hydroxamate ABC transporter substrate-binding protein FhuD n=1 Tax=Pectobacterium sp. B1J-3 TaxID=3385371 RepID=UPI0039065C91